MSKKILITGGCGMIGRRLTALLKKKRYNILVVDNLLSKLKPLKGINFKKIDISNTKSLESAFKKFKPDVVYHLAAIHHIPTCEIKRSYSQKINILGTETILRLAEKYESKKIIIASSGAVYDWKNTSLSEDKTKTKPMDNYSLCKFSNEIQLKLWTTRNKGKGISARIFNSIGYDDPNSHLLPDILKQINLKKNINKITLGTLTNKRDYIDAEDVAMALYKMINYSKKQYDVFNICTGKQHSVKDIINLLEKILKIKILVKSIKSKKRKIDRVSQLGNYKKAYKELRWKAKLNLEETLKKYIIEQKFKKLNL